MMSESTQICPMCEKRSKTVLPRRINTAYADDTQNYIVSCWHCWQRTLVYYDEMWRDYYTELIGR
jgi:hypothetical protein